MSNVSAGQGIVFFALWAKPASLRRALAERIAGKTPVVIVDQLISAVRRPQTCFLSRRVRMTPSGARVYSAYHTPERIAGLRRILKGFNRRRLVREVKSLFAAPPALVCYDSPAQDDLVGAFGEKRSVYLAIDDRTVTVTGEPIAGELEAERRLLARVDAVVCVSGFLAKTLQSRAAPRRDLPVLVIENGYDEKLFDPDRRWAEPPLLAGVSRPRVVVLGHVSERVDWAGVEACRKLRPGWAWVFVGPADAGLPEKVARLGGVCFPRVPPEEVPAWIAHADACAVPYRLNSFTRSSSPIKAFECLAMGAPTLSTPVPSLKPYGRALAWVEEADGASYAKALDTLAAEGRAPEHVTRRRDAVKRASLAARVQEFLDCVDALPDSTPAGDGRPSPCDRPNAR